MNPPANSFPDRDRLADDTGVALGEEENQRVARKLRAQTVLISRGTDGEEVRSLEDMLDDQVGTGVLVRNGDDPGILTAGHVAGDLVEEQRQGEEAQGEEVKMTIAKERKLAKMTIVQRRKLATFGSQGYLPIPLQGEIMPLSEGLGTSHEDPMDVQLKGPDIAWMRIAEEDARKLERHGGIFHNWRQSEETRAEEMRKQGRQQAGLWACGRVHEKSEKLRVVEREKLTLCAMARQVFREGPALEPEDGWDRFDYTLELYGRPKTEQSDWGKAAQDPAVEKILHEDPVSWGGMSGGGIWVVGKKQGDDLFQCSLAGVIYAQYPPNSNKPELKLRAHGIGSINRVLGRG